MSARKTAHVPETAQRLHSQARHIRRFTTAQLNRKAADAGAAATPPKPEPKKIFFTAHPPLPTGADTKGLDGAGPWRPNRPVQTQEELLTFVDPPEDGETVDDHLDFIRDPYMRGYAQADTPQVILDKSGHEAQYPTWADLEDQGEEVQRIVHALNHIVWKRLRSPHKTSAAQVYEQYRQLPGARMSTIPFSLRHRLLHALGMAEKRNAEAMLRYFAVVADVRDSGFPLKRVEWNTAMSYAGRYVGDSGNTEMEAAMQLWREMERRLGIAANDQTFNILFDVAAKAGNFTLAEMLYLEMEKRGFRYNRYHNVSLIYLFGLKMNADGVRAAYREMVMAGEMIDVTVLNCVMVSLLRCGEETAAERVYQNMFDKYRTRSTKKPAKSKPGSKKPQDEPDPIETYDKIVPAGSEVPNYASHLFMPDVLSMLARVSRKIPSLRGEYQYLTPTRPDINTYRVLIAHYAVRMGDLDSVTRYLNDMKLLRIPLHGAIFLALFKGFAIHGGVEGTGSVWAERRLRSIWAALLRALDDKVEGLYITKWMLIWSLRAFHRCSSPEMVFKAYQSLTTRWVMDEAEMDFSISFLHQLLKNSRYHYGETGKGALDRGSYNASLSVLSTLDGYSFGRGR